MFPFINKFMRKFEISDRYTSADLGLDVTGDSLEELYICAAEGMFDIILGGGTVKVTEQVELKIRSGSKEQLMVDWLSELLYLFDTQLMISSEFSLSIKKINEEFLLQSRFGLAPFDPSEDQSDYDIKAVTYHRLRIEKRDNLFKCHVVFDL